MRVLRSSTALIAAAMMALGVAGCGHKASTFKSSATGHTITGFTVGTHTYIVGQMCSHKAAKVKLYKQHGLTCPASGHLSAK